MYNLTCFMTYVNILVVRNKNTLRTNKLVILKINKNTQPQPKISGSYKKNSVYFRTKHKKVRVIFSNKYQKFSLNKKTSVGIIEMSCF